MRASRSNRTTDYLLSMASESLQTAEFFAGIGLVRLAIEQSGGSVVFANDFSSAKATLYQENFGGEDFLLGDVRDIRGAEVPPVDLATASFPCTDLSLAGNRAGLRGAESGVFWEFARVLDEMGPDRPERVLIENVPGLVTSNGGHDLIEALKGLNALGYVCDVAIVNASHFTPQSRPRLFIAGSSLVEPQPMRGAEVTEERPKRLLDALSSEPGLKLRLSDIESPSLRAEGLPSIVERFRPTARVWWDTPRKKAFAKGMHEIHRERLDTLSRSKRLTWATAYRRTRQGRPVWEIRGDDLSGCLRTSRGGSSKQAIVEAGRGQFRVRWMTPREYARLQGVGDDYSFGSVTANQALFAFGDAVCVPAVQWVLENLVLPMREPATAPPVLSLAS